MQSENIPMPPGKNTDPVKITILYDNYAFDSRLKTAWGFSCLVEGLEKKILFDTGGDGAILMNNMESLKVDPQKIDVVFLSHEHWDHVGGLMDFLRCNNKATVYLPASFSEGIKDSIRNTGADFIEISGPAYLGERVATIGELGSAVKEQSLIIETARGLVIITGCAHPGIVHIIETVKRHMGQDLYMVFGGFHLLEYSDSALKNVIRDFRDLGVKIIGPCHCSGDRCRELLEKEYKTDFLEIGVGKVILLK